VQDAAGLFAGTAGVGVVRNGSQTGMPQVRGLHADRVKILVDGRTLTPACPNHMDPPLHSLAPAHAATLLIVPGVTPVSLGGDSIAGTIVADPPAPRFGTNKVFQPFGEFTTGLSSLNNGWSGGTVAGLANRDYRVDYRGSIQRAGDYYFPGGRVRATGYDVMHHALRGAADTRHGLIRAEAGLSQTRDAGTPALPMDMIEDDGWNAAAGFEGMVISVARLESRAYFHHTDHLMDNYSLRPAGPRRMLSPARSDDLGFRTGLALPRGGETYRIGLDYHGNRFDAYQQNADSGARQNTINNGSRDRLGGYAEWQSDWSSHWTTLLGVRSDAVWSDANPIEDYFPAARPDAERFNQHVGLRLPPGNADRPARRGRAVRAAIHEPRAGGPVRGRVDVGMALHGRVHVGWCPELRARDQPRQRRQPLPPRAPPWRSDARLGARAMERRHAGGVGGGSG
jgi:iron complex outermembrane receptor protein